MTQDARTVGVTSKFHWASLSTIMAFAGGVWALGLDYTIGREIDLRGLPSAATMTISTAGILYSVLMALGSSRGAHAQLGALTGVAANALGMLIVFLAYDRPGGTSARMFTYSILLNNIVASLLARNTVAFAQSADIPQDELRETIREPRLGRVELLIYAPVMGVWLAQSVLAFMAPRNISHSFRLILLGSILLALQHGFIYSRIRGLDRPGGR